MRTHDRHVNIIITVFMVDTLPSDVARFFFVVVTALASAARNPYHEMAIKISNCLMCYNNDAKICRYLDENIGYPLGWCKEN